MPKGYLWDVLDFVPSIVDANLSTRGRWRWGSALVAGGAGDIGSGIYAPFAAGDQVIVQTTGFNGAGQRVLQLNQLGTDTASFPWIDLAAGRPSIQNPVWFFDSVGEQAVAFDAARAHPPQLWRAGGVVDANAAHKNAPVGTVWQNALFTGGAPGEENLLRWSIAGQDLTAATSFDVNAFMPTAGRITGLQGMRSMVLIFHPSSVQRFRGGPLSNTAAGIDDSGLILENLFDREGCSIPSTIATWQDQCIFANEHGVHLTDGAVIRNLTSMGGIAYYWRLLYDGAATVCACTFLDYYVVTVRHTVPDRPPPPYGWHGEEPPAELVEALQAADVLPQDDRPPVPPVPPDFGNIRPPPPPKVNGAYTTTLVCDLNRKQWFRFSNWNAMCMFSGGGGAAGATAMEKAWGGLNATGRLARLAPMFYPDPTADQVDDNGTAITPRFETPWYRLSPEGRKRIRFAYLSYDCRASAGSADPLRLGYLVNDTVSSDYVQAGTLPYTTGYARFRLPVYKFPYGIGFYVEATRAVQALRIYDLGVEAQPAERSRV